MAIKRLTIELDDSAENIGPTGVPPSLIGGKSRALKEMVSTDVTEYDTSIEANSPQDVSTPLVTTGRTFADLIIEFMNNPRAMATMLIFVPFIIFVAKIDSVQSLKYPVLTGIVLNMVWFGVPPITKAVRYIFGLKNNKEIIKRET